MRRDLPGLGRPYEEMKRTSRILELLRTNKAASCKNDSGFLLIIVFHRWPGRQGGSEGDAVGDQSRQVGGLEADAGRRLAIVFDALH